MLIGELSKRCGLSRDTIRFYEKNRLITIGRKERRYNNYKEYSEDTLQRLVTIKRIKGFGFTLNEVSELLELIDVKQATCDNVLDLFEEKVKKVDDKIHELISIRTLLLNGFTRCKNDCCTTSTSDDNCPVIVEKV